MLRKILISIGLVVLMAGFVSCSSAPDPEKEAKRRVVFDDIKNEPPMTEDEILLYIKILPEFAPFENAGNPAGEMDFYKRHNLTKNRFYYLRSKIANASLIVAGRNPDLSTNPESLKPNDSELLIVERHFKALKAATDEFIERQRQANP